MNDNEYTDEERTIIEYQKLKQENKPLGKFMRHNYYTLKKVLPEIKGGEEDLKLLNLIGPEEEYVVAETNKEKRAELNKRLNDVIDKDVKKVKPLKKDINSVKERERASSIQNIPDAELDKDNIKLNEKDIQEAFAASGRPYKKFVLDDIEHGIIPEDVKPAYEEFKKQYAEDALREYNARQFEKSFGTIAPAALSFISPRVVDKYQSGYRPGPEDIGLDLAELLAGGVIGKGVKAAKSLPRLEKIFSGAQKAKDAVSGKVKNFTQKMPVIGSAIGQMAEASVVPTAANVGFQAVDDYVYDDTGLSRGQASLSDYLKNIGFSMGFASLPEFALTSMQQKRKDAYEKALEKSGMYKNYDFSNLETGPKSKDEIIGDIGRENKKLFGNSDKGKEIAKNYAGYKAAEDIAGMENIFEIADKKAYPNLNMDRYFGDKLDEHSSMSGVLEEMLDLTYDKVEKFAKKNKMSLEDAYQYLLDNRELTSNVLMPEYIRQTNKINDEILDKYNKDKRKTALENFGKNYVPAYYTTLIGRRLFGGQNTGDEDK